MKPARIGALVLLAIAAIGAAAWFLRAPASMRYAATEGELSVMVMVRGAAPDQITVDVGGRKLTAHKVP